MRHWKGGRPKDGNVGRLRVQSKEMRSPVRISFAARMVLVGVRRFRAPISSVGPYKPQAFPGGPDLSIGRAAKGGRVRFGVVSEAILCLM
jgi:hypothetical protein